MLGVPPAKTKQQRSPTLELKQLQEASAGQFLGGPNPPKKKHAEGALVLKARKPRFLETPPNQAPKQNQRNAEVLRPFAPAKGRPLRFSASACLQPGAEHGVELRRGAAAPQAVALRLGDEPRVLPVFLAIASRHRSIGSIGRIRGRRVDRATEKGGELELVVSLGLGPSHGDHHRRESTSVNQASVLGPLYPVAAQWTTNKLPNYIN